MEVNWPGNAQFFDKGRDIVQSMDANSLIYYLISNLLKRP